MLTLASTTTIPSNTTKASVVPNKESDLKVEIWAPIIGGIVLIVIIVLVAWRVKRTQARISDNRLRSDRRTRDPNADETIYENYASSDNCNNIQRVESYYSQLYTAYDDDYAEYKEPYAEYKKPKK